MNGAAAFTDQGSIVNLLADKLSSNFTSNFLPDPQGKIPSNILPTTISRDLLLAVLAKVNNTTSVGPDKIPNCLLNSLKHGLSELLEAIFNYSLKTGCIPSE